MGFHKSETKYAEMNSQCKSNKMVIEFLYANIRIQEKLFTQILNRNRKFNVSFNERN